MDAVATTSSSSSAAPNAGFARLAARGMKPAAALAATRPHGDRVRYMAGCRCDECRKANSRYECQRAKARKAGDWNGIVPADKARAHIEALSSKGVGRRTLADASGVAETIIIEIRTGAKAKIRARTERAILAVTEKAAMDGAYIDAAPTWDLLNKLIADGYTKKYLAKRLGSKAKTPALQISTKQTTVRHAYEVEKLYDELVMCDAKGTWQMLRNLLTDGFTRREIESKLADMALKAG